MNSSKERYIRSKDGKDIFLRLWDNVKNPKGIVQIFHGMAEHSERYNEFADFLNSNGYIVCADDHRGHGKSLINGKVKGYIGENGFYKIVEDEKIITDIIKKEHEGLPLYIFAHSFGSFIGQEYITKYSREISGIILSGSAKQDGIDIKFGGFLAKLQNMIYQDKVEAKLIDKLSFGAFNNKVENRKTQFDWLSRNEAEVQKYIKDENCGFISPINFYYNMFNGLNNLYQKEKLFNIDLELPILVFSGDEDPVGKYGKSVEKLYNQYKSLGIKYVQIKLYEGGRHELLNEINKDEVYEFVYNWINKINEPY